MTVDVEKKCVSNAAVIFFFNQLPDQLVMGFLIFTVLQMWSETQIGMHSEFSFYVSLVSGTMWLE